MSSFATAGVPTEVRFQTTDGSSNTTTKGDYIVGTATMSSGTSFSAAVSNVRGGLYSLQFILTEAGTATVSVAVNENTAVSVGSIAVNASFGVAIKSSIVDLVDGKYASVKLGDVLVLYLDEKDAYGNAVESVSFLPTATLTTYTWQTSGGDAASDASLPKLEGTPRAFIPFTMTYTNSANRYILRWTPNFSGRHLLQFQLNSTNVNGIAEYAIVCYTSTAPTLTSARMQDKDKNGKWSDDDTILLKFSAATNAPDVSTKEAIDGLLTFSASLGSSYSGAWTDASTAKELLITVTDTTGAGPPVGDETTVSVNFAGYMTAKDLVSAPVTTSSLALAGFTATPASALDILELLIKLATCAEYDRTLCTISMVVAAQTLLLVIFAVIMIVELVCIISGFLIHCILRRRANHRAMSAFVSSSSLPNLHEQGMSGNHTLDVSPVAHNHMSLTVNKIRDRSLSTPNRPIWKSPARQGSFKNAVQLATHRRLMTKNMDDLKVESFH